MSRLRRALGLALIGMTVLTLVASEPVSADTGGDELDFVARINGLRASKGLAPLVVQGELFDLSRAWSSRMAASGSLAHNQSLAAQAPAGWTRLAENVGTAGDVAGIFEFLVASPVHYANMVDPGFQSVGVGVAQNASAQKFATMTFMAGGDAPVLVRRSVRVCTKNRRGRTVCVRRIQMVPA